jgi:phosphohistidine phosphatase SixA/8-oxo-dGTP pyrophosphatase MutT (NUDIX family)
LTLVVPDGVVRAAGGVVVRNDGELRLVVVHRPEYEDWTLPKGKCEPGESWEDCALREVQEETSLVCHLLGSAIGTTEYVDRRGRPKQVRWWLMRPDAGELRGQSEVDVARWATPAEALALLTYERDRELLQPLLKESRVWVVRHADAGDRAAWTRPDQQRPLDRRGQEQARLLAEVLRQESIDRLLSSPYLRCVQTLEPLAAALGQPVDSVEELGEGYGLDGIEPLLIGGQAVVACTHGDVLEELLSELRREDLVPAGAKAPKGSTWVLRSRAGLIEHAEYIAPPA